MKVIERAIAVAMDVDIVRMVLSRRLPERIGFDIWNDIRADGVLRRRVRRTFTEVRADGTEQERETFEFETHAHLAGYQMLNPKAGNFTDAVKRCLATLAKANFGEHPQSHIDALNDIERDKAARSIGRPISNALTVFAEIEECRRFLSPESVATLNAWGRHPDSPATIWLKLHGNTLHIGKTKDEAKPMSLGALFSRSLGALPQIGSVRDV